MGIKSNRMTPGMMNDERRKRAERIEFARWANLARSQIEQRETKDERRKRAERIEPNTVSS